MAEQNRPDRKVDPPENHAHQWNNYLHTAYVLVRKPLEHHCKLCSDCGRLLCEVQGYHFDKHKSLVEQFHLIMDEASMEYDSDEQVVEDFQAYAQDWAQRRLDTVLDRASGI